MFAILTPTGLACRALPTRLAASRILASYPAGSKVIIDPRSVTR